MFEFLPNMSNCLFLHNFACLTIAPLRIIPIPWGTVSAEIRVAYEENNERPASRRNYSHRRNSCFDAIQCKHQAVHELVVEKADNAQNKLTGRDGANRRHLPACSNFYLAIISATPQLAAHRWFDSTQVTCWQPAGKIGPGRG